MQTAPSLYVFGFPFHFKFLRNLDLLCLSATECGTLLSVQNVDHSDIPGSLADHHRHTLNNGNHVKYLLYAFCTDSSARPSRRDISGSLSKIRELCPLLRTCSVLAAKYIISAGDVNRRDAPDPAGSVNISRRNPQKRNIRCRLFRRLFHCHAFGDCSMCFHPHQYNRKTGRKHWKKAPKIS